MKHWRRGAALAALLMVAAATCVTANPRRFGGRFGGGARISGRFGDANFRLGFGSRFGSRRFQSSFWGYPGYGYPGFAAFPGYGYPSFTAFPGFGYSPFLDFGYGYPFPLLSYSPTDTFLPFWNNAWGVSRNNLPYASNYNAQPNVIQLPPSVVVIDNSAAPRITDGSARLERDGERFYLEPRRVAPEREQPSTLKDTLRRNLRIESAETDQYLVRWTGDPSELAALELTALDADRKVVMRRLIKASPFRGLLNTGGKTTMVTVSFDLKDGPTVTLEYPLERFQSLAE